MKGKTICHHNENEKLPIFEGVIVDVGIHNEQQEVYDRAGHHNFTLIW